MRSSLITFLLIFLITFKPASGQRDTLLWISNHHESVFKAGDKPGNRNTDYILYTLAIGNSQSLSSLQFNVGFKTRLVSYESPGPYAEVSLSVDELILSGDYQYRSFDFSSYLLPDKVIGYITSTPGLQMHPVEFSLQHQNWPFQLTIIEKENLHHGNLHLEIAEYSYSDEAIQKFTDMVLEVNNYWASINLIDSVFASIKQHGVDDRKNPVELFTYWDLCRKVHLITGELANKYAHSVANGKLKEVHNQLARMKTRLKTLLEIEIEKQKDTALEPIDFVNAYLGMLAHQRQLSLRIEFQDADMFYQSGRLIADSHFAALLTHYDDKFHNSNAAVLILDRLLASGDSLRKHDELTHALDYYEDALHLTGALDLEMNTSELTGRIVQTQQGLLQAYFRIAARAVESGNFQLANEYELKTLEFINRHFIASGIQVSYQESFEKLAEAYLIRSETLMSQNHIESAADMLNNIQQLTLRFDIEDLSSQLNEKLTSLHRQIYLFYVRSAETNYKKQALSEAANELSNALLYRQQHINYLQYASEAEELQRQIREPVIRQVIYQGMQAFNLGQHDEALDNFLKAREEAKQHELKIEYSLDSLASLAAKPIILKYLKGAHLKIWANDFDEAWAIYKNAMSLRQTFSLSADHEIKAAFDDLDQRFIQRICLNHQLKYLQLIDQAEKAIRNNTYEKLRAILIEANKLASDNPGCEIDRSKSMKYLEDYRLLFSYLDRMESIFILLRDKNYEEAASDYISMDNEIETYDLGRYEYVHQSFIHFLRQNNDAELRLMALPKFIESGDAQSAFAVLKLLQKQGYRHSKLKDYQAQTGHLLAVYDFAEGHRTKPEDRAIAHTGESKWFKPLRKAYINTIQQLQHKP